MIYYALTYYLCENYIVKRTAHREDHFNHIQKYKSKGQFLMGGAFDNQQSALLILTVKDEQIVKNFIQNDPYVINGVVTSWQYEKWNMVTGDVTPVSE